MKKVRIELTNEVVKAITMCCPLAASDSSELCSFRCALAGACLEYYTGDRCENQEQNNREQKV